MSIPPNGLSRSGSVANGPPPSAGINPPHSAHSVVPQTPGSASAPQSQQNLNQIVSQILVSTCTECLVSLPGIPATWWHVVVYHEFMSMIQV